MARTPKAEAVAGEYFALTPIEHDLQAYAVGASITLTDDEAAPLLAVNAIRAGAPAAPEAEPAAE